MKQLSREQRLRNYSMGARKACRNKKWLAVARALHEHQEDGMHVEIQRRARKPHTFSVVVADEAGRYGILNSGIPSFSEAKSLARKEGFERSLPVINRVHDEVRSSGWAVPPRA